MILDSLLYNCPVVDSFLSFVFECLGILSVSLQFLFNCWLFLLIVGSKLKNSLRKWQSPLHPSRDISLFLRKRTGFVPKFWILDHTLSWFVCSSIHVCLSCPVAQFHLVPLRPPSNFFIHTLSLPVLSKTQLQMAFSLHAGALSLCHSRPPIGICHSVGVTEGVTSPAAHRGTGVWCGCHEILIPCSTTTLFSTGGWGWVHRGS